MSTAVAVQPLHGRGHGTGLGKDARPPLVPFSLFGARQQPAPAALSLAAADRELAFPAPLPSNLTALLLGHTGPAKARHGSVMGGGAHDENAASSSSSPYAPSSKSPRKAPSTTATAGRRTVSFSSSPLESLHSSPRHARSHHAFLPLRLRQVYSASARSTPLFGTAVLDKSADARRVASPPPAQLAPDFDDCEMDDDAATDDEAESASVYQLLLSSPSPAQSPSRPPALAQTRPSPARVPAVLTPLGSTFPPTMPVPQSILKRSQYPIMRAPNAIEGSRRNGGRRKHALAFSDADAAAKLDLLAAKGTVTASGSTTTGRGTVDGAKRARKAGDGAPAAASTSGVAGGRAAAGRGAGDDPPEAPNPRSSGAPTSSASRPAYPPDDDPVHLRVPLLTLRESLRTFLAPLHQPVLASSADSPPAIPSGLLPRATLDKSSPLHLSMRGAQASVIALTTDTATDSSSDDDSPSLPAVPVLLPEIESAYARLVRALIRLPPTLADASHTLAPLIEYRGSLLRSLDRDISNVISFPLAPVRPRGFLGDMGSSSGSDSGSSSPLKPDAGKCTARKGLSDEEMRRQKDEAGVAQIAIKVVAALAQQERLYSLFSHGELNELISKILAIPGAATIAPSVPKDIYPFVTFFLSTQRLPKTLIAPHIFRIATVLRTTLSTVDKPRYNLGESITAVAHLVRTHPDLFLAHWRSWFRPTVEGLWEVPKKGTSVKLKTVVALGEVVKAIMVPREGEDDAARLRREEAADGIAEELKVALYRKHADKNTALFHLTAQLDACLQTDEAIWALHVIGLLPALLGKLFRKLEPKGVRPWIQLVGKCREHTSADVRALSTLLWNHLASAFMRTTLDDGSVWVFRADGKPFQLLIQLFGSTPAGWQSPAKDAAYALALAGTLFGLSVLNRTFVPEDCLANLDIVWDRVVAVSLRGAMASQESSIASVGWATLAAIVSPPKEDAPKATLDWLVNPVFLDGAPPKGKVAPVGELARRGLEAACQPAEIPGWATEWTGSRAVKVLKVVEQALGLEELPEATVVQVLEPNVFACWRNFMSALSAAGDAANLDLVLTWLTQICPSAPTFAIQFAGTTLNILGSFLVPLSPERAELISRLASTVLAALPAFPTAEADATALIAFLVPVLATLPPAVLAQTTVRVVGQVELYAALLDPLAAKWASALDEEAHSIDADGLDAVLSLLIAHLNRSSLEAEAQEPWTRLASSLGLAVLADGAPAALSDAFKAHFGPPTSPAEDLRALSLLIHANETLPSEAAHDRLLSCASVALLSAFTMDGQAHIMSGARMLHLSSDTLFVPLYVQLLDHLKTTVAPTAALLESLTPLLLQPLQRAFDIQTNSQLVPTVCTNVIGAFADFWGATFQRATEPLDVSSELADFLNVIYGATLDFDVPDLETQGASQRAPTPASSAGPAPAQAVASAADSSMMLDDSALNITANQSGLGYDADSSRAPRSSDEFSLMGKKRHEGSPSLRFNTASAAEMVEETPPDLQNTRSRSSLASMASNASLASAGGSAQVPNSQASSRESRSLKRNRAPSPSPPPPSRPLRRTSRSTSDLPSSETDDEDRVIVTRRNSSQLPLKRQPAAKKAKVDPESSTRSSRSGRSYPVVEIPVRRSSKRSLLAASLDAAGPSSEKRPRSAEPDKPDSSSWSAAGDLTDASASDAGAQEDEPLSAEATAALQTFLTLAHDAPRQSVLNELNKFMGPTGRALFLDVAELAHEQYPVDADDDVVPETDPQQ